MKKKITDEGDDKSDQIDKKEMPVFKDIKIYFIRFNEATENIYLTSVNRKIGQKSQLESAIKELIKGPKPSEKKKGFLTAIPPDLMIRNIRVRNKTAVLDFNSAIERGANGNILISRIDQIVYTATQFSNIKNVVIKINGRTKKSLGSDGLSLSGPLHRR